MLLIQEDSALFLSKVRLSSITLPGNKIVTYIYLFIHSFTYTFKYHTTFITVIKRTIPCYMLAGSFGFCHISFLCHHCPVCRVTQLFYL